MAAVPQNIVGADALDFASIIRPGDRVICGQAAAEPLTLTEALVAQAHRLPPFEMFLGPVYSKTFTAERTDGIVFSSYGAMGQAVTMAARGRLDVVALPYSQLCAEYASGQRMADVVLLQLSSRSAQRGLNLSLSNDYVLSAARNARIVIAEINPHAPWTHDAELPDDVPLHLCVAARREPLEVPAATLDDTARKIAAHAAALIPDGATLQFGVGRIPEAILANLGHLRNLGIHSGLINDVTVDLIECGVVTNAEKGIDRGVSVTNQLIGTRRLYDHAHGNPAIVLRPAAYTHGHEVLSQIRRLVAINSAIEVGLDGSINAQIVSGVAVGGIGGQLDFVRGANASDGGRAIIALPSTVTGGVSRIVPRVETVTTPADAADAIVTEFGAAELRGCDPDERARRLVAIAAPEHREMLSRAAFSAREDGVK
ncbi:MAG: acetyl-CoA hydrolase/transferase family protein [Pseudomonadota bacterium]